MFSFFKKKKKKIGPEFDKKLIKRLQADHIQLVNQVGKIETAYAKENEKNIKRELQILKSLTLDHFIKEDLKLYWYLKTFYKEKHQTLEEIKYFEESLKDIQVAVINFLDQYAKPDVLLNSTFKNEFDGIVEALANRISKEENNLYPLYKKTL